MQSSKSPFDDALARPLMDEPVKKRWSWLTSSTSSSEDSNVSVNYREYEAPDIQVITFETPGQQAGVEEEGRFVLAAALEEGRPTDLEAAIFQERHAHLSEINADMHVINEIQKDIATAVQAQQHDIDGIEYMAIESAEHASGGLRHLVEVQRQAAKLARRRRRAALIAAAGLLVFVGLHWVVTSMHSSNHGSPTWHVLEEELLLD